MTVETLASRQRYIGDGSTSQFDFTFPYFASADIRLIQKVNGVEALLIEGAHYSLTRVGAGGRINLGAPMVANSVLSILRDPAPIQGTELVSNDKVFLETIERQFDRQAMIQQRQADLLTRSIVLAETDVDGSGAFQARNNRLSGLAPGVNAQDAATIAQLQAVAGGDIIITPEVIGVITAQVIGDPTLAALFSPINTQLGSLAGLIAGLDADIAALSQIAGDPTNIITLIMTEQAERIAGDSALATTVSKLGALSGDSLSFILNLSTAKVSSTESLAQRLNGIAATLGSNEAAILAEQTARSNQYSSLAASIVTVQTQAAGAVTSVQTIQSSVNGILGKYVVKIDNNGYVAGFGLLSEPNNGTVTSAFVVLADQFRIANPGNPSVSPFFVNGGRVYMRDVVIDTAAIGAATIGKLQLQTSAVSTEKIEPNAVHDMDAIEVAHNAYGPIGAAVEQQIATVSLTATGARVVIQGLIGNNGFGVISPIFQAHSVRLYRNGTKIKDYFVTSATQPDQIFDVDTPPAGGVTYSLRVESSVGFPESPQAELSAIQYKR